MFIYSNEKQKPTKIGEKKKSNNLLLLFNTSKSSETKTKLFHRSHHEPVLGPLPDPNPFTKWKTALQTSQYVLFFLVAVCLVCYRTFTLAVYFVRYTRPVPGWTPSAFVLCSIESLRCWKHSRAIWVRTDTTASRSCCRFVGCTDSAMLFPSFIVQLLESR